MYFIKFLASISVSNAPIEINVGVAETKGFPISGAYYKDIYNEFDNLIADGIKKFHMPLQQASVMLETILTQKEAAQSKTRRAGS